MATGVGSVIGAVIGSKVGGGSARYATSAIGTAVGGMAGREIYDQAQRERQRASVTVCDPVRDQYEVRSEEHTSELQSLMRISYAVFCLKKKKNKTTNNAHI